MSTQTKKGAFPFTLHDILERAERQGYNDIISWTPCGTALLVHRREAFIARRFFGLTKYKSFSRQLNLWGFTCSIGAGPYHGAYTHPSFLRGNRDACRHIVRQKKKNKTSKMAMTSTSTTREPTETMTQASRVNPPEGAAADATPDTAIDGDVTSGINEANALITPAILSYMAQQLDISYPETETETETESNHNIDMPPTADHRTAKDLDMSDDWIDDLFALPIDGDFFTSSLDHFCFDDLDFEEGEFTL